MLLCEALHKTPFHCIQVSLLINFICNSSSYNCMLRLCDDCKDNIEKWSNKFMNDKLV